MDKQADPIYWQHTLVLPAQRRGFHCIDRYLTDVLNQNPKLTTGFIHLFLQHTSASLVITENCCADVKRDLARFYDQLSPDSREKYAHNIEGPDDMPAHIKSSLMGVSLTLPVQDTKPALGRWQGIYLGEHRDNAGSRQILITAHGYPELR